MNSGTRTPLVRVGASASAGAAPVRATVMRVRLNLSAVFITFLPGQPQRRGCVVLFCFDVGADRKIGSAGGGLAEAMTQTGVRRFLLESRKDDSPCLTGYRG